MMPMKQAMQNLLYVEKALRNGTYKAEAPMLTVLLEEALEEIKNTSFQFEVPCSSDTNIEHLKTYENLALKYKAKLLVDIRKLQHEINKKNVNGKYCLNLVQKIIESNLYMNHVKAMIQNTSQKTKFLKLKS
ncbi:hypothetical protein PcaKH15_31470 [Parageobacillus caldoxylosilyticus]|nr:hypothetical protein PcaKH15_31470 [Parageobacillus caldoxylosilyticus]BDG41032.1 hypothetical protein PcaKH16_31710 [Parageobacillus caldoxylosilyticus]BDG44783.1 hypothetical protein PcaKH35_31280 [Parageobacillus caldoxylosilyticus]